MEMRCHCVIVMVLISWVITVIIKCPFLALIKKLICDFLSQNASVIVNFLFPLTLYVPMNSSFLLYKIYLGWSIVYIKGSQVII